MGTSGARATPSRAAAPSARRRPPWPPSTSSSASPTSRSGSASSSRVRRMSSTQRMAGDLCRARAVPAIAGGGVSPDRL